MPSGNLPVKQENQNSITNEKLESKSYTNTVKENLEFIKQTLSQKGINGNSFISHFEQKVDTSMNQNILLAGGVLNTFNNIISSALLISKGSGSLKGYGIFNLIIYILIFLFFCYYGYQKFNNNSGKYNKLNNIILYIIIIFTLISIIVYGVYIKDENISDETSKGYQVFSNFLNALTLMMITLSNSNIIAKEEVITNSAAVVANTENGNGLTNPQEGGKRKYKKRANINKKKKDKFF